MEEESSRCRSGIRVCVTGGAGFIGSSLVKKLLQRGYTVHATLRNLGDEKKVSLLKSFPHGSTPRLKLFEADIYKPKEFEEAIKGCEFVLHVATPLYHTEGYEYNNRIDATVAATKSIAESCLRSGTVRRLIYTASIVAASPMRDDGSGFKDSMDESCWTPLHVSFPCADDSLWDYTGSKTLAEKEILAFGHEHSSALQVTTLACGLVGGQTCLSHTALSTVCLVSPLLDDPISQNALKFLEELDGKVPIAHIEDVCGAHIFCMEEPLAIGRFLCANSYVSTSEITEYFQQNHPDVKAKMGVLEGPKRNIKWNSTKLEEMGFVYKYDTKMILDDSIKCAREIGDLKI